MPSKVIIIDYGSQVTQLIARRVREAGVYSEIHSCITTAAQVAAMKPSAVILSGGPASVGEADAPVLDPGLLELGDVYALFFLDLFHGRVLYQSASTVSAPATLSPGFTSTRALSGR